MNFVEFLILLVYHLLVIPLIIYSHSSGATLSFPLLLAYLALQIHWFPICFVTVS